MDILEKLEVMAALKEGESPPDWLGVDIGNWAEQMSQLFGEAADEIKRLRSVAGAVSDGPSASEIKQEVNDGPSV